MNTVQNRRSTGQRAAITPRNFVAKNAQRSGAGRHDDKKINRHERSDAEWRYYEKEWARSL